MVKKVLITGITGFKGSHLAEYLLSEGHEVYGIVRWRSRMENIEHIKDKLNLIDSDIRDPFCIFKTISDVRPDIIIHLAAQSFVQESLYAPAATYDTNIIGTLNILESLRYLKSKSTLVIAGTSEEYGLVHPEETPITEQNVLRPQSPYGASKVICDVQGLLYQKSYGLNVIVTRAFNTTGPRRGEVFATSTFAKQIAEIEAGLKPPVVQVGNLDAKRDFTDVRDTVKAYWLVANKGIPGEVYNICSGETHRIGDVLDILLSLSTSNISVEIDQSRLRPSDVPLLLGNCDKLKKQTGWSPTIPFYETMADLLNYWRIRLGIKEKDYA